MSENISNIKETVVEETTSTEAKTVIGVNTKIYADIGEKGYIFEFDRQRIEYAERVLGFEINKLATGKEPILQSNTLWVAGLVKNHPELSLEQAKDLKDLYFEEGGDVDEILTALIEIYSAFSQTTQQSLPKKKAKIV